MNADSGNWAFKEGDTFQQYKVLRLLGAGLHGEVYLIEHRLTHDRFALKVMHLEDVREASRVRRALSTALAGYRIQHANVVTVHDIGCEEDGKVWVRMEYLDGGSIGDLLARQRGRVSLQLAFHVAIEAAWAIDAAHEMQIIHRDVKPENVWLTLAGVVKVIDFSLAKVIPDGIQTTQRKTGFGTAPYMAPEALKGAVPDARVDIYALGMMLWQMLGGRHPFHDVLRNTNEIIRRQLHVTPAPLSSTAGLPPYVDEFMRRAIAKNPAERFFTMAEMARAMMTLRDRLREDAARGLFDTEVPPGEPRIPGEPWTGRRYHGTHEIAEAGPEPAVPSQRVVVASTQRLPQGPGGTLPLLSSRPAVPLPHTAAPLPAVAPRSEQPTPRAVPPAAPSPARVTPAPPRDTATAVMRSASQDVAPARARAWSPALLVVLALLSVLATSIGVVAWRRARLAAVPPASSSAPAVPAVAPSPVMEPAAPENEPHELEPSSSASDVPAPAHVATGTAATRAAQPLASSPPAAVRPSPRRSSHSLPPTTMTSKAPDPPPPPSAASTVDKPASNRLFGTEN